MADLKRRWAGGYVATDAAGRPIFIIEKRIKKRRWHVSTRCHTERAAMKQLERFEADPVGYRAENGDRAAGEPVVMTEELLRLFHQWHLVERGNTPKYARETVLVLLEWAHVLEGRDLRRVTLRDDIRPVLDGTTMRRTRIAALKTFYGWLRKERHLLTSAEDPTLDLTPPPYRPEKRRRRKVVELERVQAAANHLAPTYRDCLQLLIATAWHVTELERFIRHEESEIVRPEGVTTTKGEPILAVLITRHKGSKLTRTPLLHPEQLEAAVRLRATGTVPRRLNDELKRACRKAGVEPFTAGVMRHTVLTWAHERGGAVKDISEFAGHEDERTTRGIYIDLAVPTVAVHTEVLH